MPVTIYSLEKPRKKFMSLCLNSWDLIVQVSALEKWLSRNARRIKPGCYVADIGFSIRKNGGSGGAALSSEAMLIMGKLGMELFLSEYPYNATKRTKSRVR